MKPIRIRGFGRRKRYSRYQTAGHITNYISQEFLVIMPTTNINLKDSQAGMINTGSLQEIESIDIRITAIKKAAGEELAEAFKELVEAVVNNKELESETHREELLQQIDLLAQQAALDVEKRKPGLVKAALSAVASTCASVGGLAEAWSTWGPQIEAFLS